MTILIDMSNLSAFCQRTQQRQHSFTEESGHWHNGPPQGRKLPRNSLMYQWTHLQGELILAILQPPAISTKYQFGLFCSQKWVPKMRQKWPQSCDRGIGLSTTTCLVPIGHRNIAISSPYSYKETVCSQNQAHSGLQTSISIPICWMISINILQVWVHFDELMAMIDSEWVKHDGCWSVTHSWQFHLPLDQYFPFPLLGVIVTSSVTQSICKENSPILQFSHQMLKVINDRTKMCTFHCGHRNRSIHHKQSRIASDPTATVRTQFPFAFNVLHLTEL